MYITDCDEVLNAFYRTGDKPQRCGHSDKNLKIICCPEPKVIPTTTRRPPRLRPTTDSSNFFFINTFSNFSLTLECKEYSRLRLENLEGDAPVSKFPHEALVLTKSNQMLCNGALISERFVLTSARCANNRQDNMATFVKLGDLQETQDAEKFRMYEIFYRFVHPQYESDSINYDIGLTELKQNVKFNQFIHPICMHELDRNSEQKIIVTAIDFNYDSNLNSYQMTIIEMETMRNRDCRRSFEKNVSLYDDLNFDTMVCTIPKQANQSTCQETPG